MSTRPPAALYRGRTTHVRFTPYERRFSYRVFQISLDIDRIAETAGALKLFAHNRFAFFSFHDRDHGPRTGAPLRPWAEAAFARAGIDLSGGRIDLLTFPRVLGYVFNPLSLYLGYDADGAPRAIIYEVNNTFGETHSYVAPITPGAAHHADKRLHVSPFFDVRGEYRFTLSPPGERLALTIENLVAGRREHLATLIAHRLPLTDARLLAAFFTLPFMTLQVIAAIYWQAFRLWLRGARYRPKPLPPTSPLSVAKPAGELNIG